MPDATVTTDAGPTDVHIERDVPVPMRDGVHLATDIYRPAADGRPLDGPFPVILERTPYGKGVASRSERMAADATPRSRRDVAAAFVRDGYVVIFQDTRGRYGSEGRFVKYLSDGADGYDTMAWITAQPWCDGKVGTMGLSYAAHTQSALACLNPPGLAAMFLDSGGFSNAYQSGIRQGGAFELKQATWAFNNALISPEIAASSLKRKAMGMVDLRSWFTHMPWSRGHSPLALAPSYEDYLFEQWQQGDFGDYWKQVGLYAEGAYDTYADVPVVHMSSWYDPYPRTAVENYLGLKARKTGPVRLILGPWTHGDRSVTYAGDVDFGPAATLDGQLAEDFLTLRRRWFDHWLRGIDNGVDREPAVHLFVMGGGSGRRNRDGRLDHGGAWRTATDWPLPGTRFTNYYLGPDGTLDPTPPRDVGSAGRFDYDPRRPVPTIGGAISSGEPLMVGGAFDQVEGPRFFGSREPYRALAERPDVLVFQTPPLDEDVAVIGPVTVTLWIASDCPDTDFTAKLIDVHPPTDDYPDGFAMNLTDGILRIRYRDSWERPSLMTPGDVYRIVITAFPTANRFKRGHRIRLDISSSNFPRFDFNPNTGEPEGAWRETRVAGNRVHLDRDRPSHVTLPIVPLLDPSLRSG
jgi:putative CocE/NonD family hydrolase